MSRLNYYIIYWQAVQKQFKVLECGTFGDSYLCTLTNHAVLYFYLRLNAVVQHFFSHCQMISYPIKLFLDRLAVCG